MGGRLPIKTRNGYEMYFEQDVIKYYEEELLAY